MSRMSMLCSWCGARVPEELRFSPAEIRRIEEEEEAACRVLDGKARQRQAKGARRAIFEGIAEVLGWSIVKKLDK
jgi:hypothetical protein